jgi:hypothetical protein
MPLFISASPLASGVGSLLATAEYEIGTINSTIYGWRNMLVFPSLRRFLCSRTPPIFCEWNGRIAW